MILERIALCRSCERGSPATRRLDFALGVYMVVFGGFLLHPSATMDGPSFDIILSWADEWTWGCAVLVTGLVQIAANLAQGRKTWAPYGRAVTHYFASIIWVAIALGFGAVNPWGTAPLNYTMLSLAHVFCGVLAAQDAAKQAIAHHGR